jgi:hypothetical protein
MWRVALLGLLVARVAAAECEISAQAPVSVDVVGTTATLTVNGRTRVIEAKTCEELAKSVAVVIKMVLAAPHDDSPPDSRSATTEADESAPTETRQEAPRSDAVLDPQTRATVVADMTEVSASGEIDPLTETEHAVVAAFGTSTTLGEALTVGMRWRWDTVSVSTELAGELPGGVELDANVSIIRVSAAFVPCRHSGDFAVCGVARAGFDHGSGSNLMNERAATEVRADLGARLAWERPVTDHFALQLRAELDVATTSSQFDVDEVAVWRNSRFTGLAGAGVVVRFP